MKRTWVIPGILVAGLTSLGALTYAASAQDGGGRDGGGYSRGDGPRDYGRSGPRWRDDDRRRDDDRGPRWRRGDDDDRCGPRGRGWDRGDHGWRHHERGYGRHHGYGPRDGRGFDRRDESDRGYDRRGHERHGGFGRGGPGRFDPAELDSVKKEIGVTAAQEQAWTKYAGAVKEAADSARKRREGMDAGAARGLSAEDFRKFRDLLIEQRRKEQDSVRTAVDELIKSLDEKQVAIAREVLPGYAFGPSMRGAGMGFGGGRYR
jgi:hypothetical protein